MTIISTQDPITILSSVSNFSTVSSIHTQIQTLTETSISATTAISSLTATETASLTVLQVGKKRDRRGLIGLSRFAKLPRLDHLRRFSDRYPNTCQLPNRDFDVDSIRYNDEFLDFSFADNRGEVSCLDRASFGDWLITHLLLRPLQNQTSISSTTQLSTVVDPTTTTQLGTVTEISTSSVTSLSTLDPITIYSSLSFFSTISTTETLKETSTSISTAVISATVTETASLTILQVRKECSFWEI